jgi:hypothetical protein
VKAASLDDNLTSGIPHFEAVASQHGTTLPRWGMQINPIDHSAVRSGEGNAV